MALWIRDRVVVIQYQNQSARNIEQAVERRREDLCYVGLWLLQEVPSPVCQAR